jgi:uncharacterized protein
LSLSGGGYRGLYTASVLAALERDLGRPLGRCFELISGTSIGGILALAVAFEVPMAKVVTAFEKIGPTLFPPRSSNRIKKALRKWDDYRGPPYSLTPLQEVVESLIGAGSVLGDAKHPVLIPAINLTEGQPQIFKTRHLETFDRDWRLNAASVALATAAAPTFFPPVSIANCLYVDGGLVANAPDYIAFHEATYFLKQNPEDVWMLSVGTTTTKYSIADAPGHTYGTSFWVVDDAHRLPNVLISAQQQFAEQILRHLLIDRYVRIDTAPSHEQAPHLGLDKATPVAMQILRGLGGKVGTDVRSKPPVNDLLSHEARNFLLPQ